MNKDEMRKMLYELDMLFFPGYASLGRWGMMCSNPTKAAELVSKMLQELDGEEPKKVCDINNHCPYYPRTTMYEKR